MSDSVPSAKSVTDRGMHDRNLYRRIVKDRGLCGLANNTKWDELTSAMRSRMGKAWTPKNRCKCLDSSPSYWDGEWFYHLPFPLMSLEWLDLSFLEKKKQSSSTSITVDHSGWIEELLNGIGLDYQKGKSVIRIFGYSPRNFDLFEA
ncbi:DUF6678 family protein [Pedosphaera parvula]|uniref:Uncharacterized protein n=1 Tax=Pedosphaera parvula (strain Ellin514) TaxID=320771 RepID=B9XEL4_PEDPL|nr:DUF6678 family protein [Pedosphaera parvula]EEF61728.1 hypothetical protein Cflav_PD4768 [Pedosphaera parvula Ellin514]